MSSYTSSDAGRGSPGWVPEGKEQADSRRPRSILSPGQVGLVVPTPELQLSLLEADLIPDLQLKEMKLRDAHLPMMRTGGGQFGVRHVASLDPGLIHALVTLEGRVHVASGGP